MTMSIWRRRTVPLLLGVLLAAGLIVAQPKPEPAFAACDIADPTAQACIDTVTGQVDYWRNWSQPTIDAAVASAQATAQQCLQDCQVLINSFVAEAQYLAGFAYAHTCGPSAVIVGWPSCEQLLSNVIALVVQTGTSIVYGLLDQATRPDYPAQLAATVTTLALAIVDIFVTIANNVVNLLMPTAQGAVAQAGAIVNPVVAQATGTVNGAVAQATGIVNPVVGQVQSIANNPLAAAQPVFGLVNSIVGTVQAAAASLQPTVDQATYTALQTVNSALTTLQGTVAFIASQVPDPNSAAAQVVALANSTLPTVMQAVAQVQAVAFRVTGLAAPDGDNNTGDAGSSGGLPSTDPAYYVEVAKKLVVATQYETDVDYGLAKYLDPTTESAVVSAPDHCYLDPMEHFGTSSTRSSTCYGSPGPVKPTPRIAEHPDNELANHPLYLQSREYTCAPSSAREVLQYYTHSDFGEMNLANEMGTNSSNGTYWDTMVKVMNRKSTIQYLGETIGGPDKLMTRVVYDVNGDRELAHGTVLNVNQSHLSYWHRTANDYNKHYLVASGYNFRSGGHVILLDGGNQGVLGRHDVALTEAYQAVAANKSLIIW
ncbi:MAG: Peptidase like family [Actinomycetota bacterium]|jgi:hypothetical protein|nr:Peptidase like family [Actinomycetota bacterium]